MYVFIKLFVLLELVELSHVVSYTVVLKPVKPLYPAVKVYRYEVRHPKIITEGNTQYVYHKPVPSQRIYPIPVKQPTILRAPPPLKKERKFLVKVLGTTENPVNKDQRLYSLPQQLTPPLSNQIEEYSENKEENKEEESRGPENEIPHVMLPSPHDEKSFASFPQERGRIYQRPGVWATPVPYTEPENTSTSAFTPSQLYLQIRHKNTVIHVPQSEALKDAETLEELINAPRLKELARTTHVQEVYSEEGYEDAAYDHAGHFRHAQHGEVYDAKDEGKFRIKEPPIIIDYDSDLEESKKAPVQNLNPTGNSDDDKVEPRITRSRTETNKKSVEYAKKPQTYKGEHKYSSRVKKVKLEESTQKGLNFTESKEVSDVPPTFPSYFGEVPPLPAESIANETILPYKPGGKLSAKYRKGEFNSTKIFPILQPPSSVPPPQIFTDFTPLTDAQASPSGKSIKYSKIYSKKTKQLRLEPYKTGTILQPPPLIEESPSLSIPRDYIDDEPASQRIILPTIGYINSLTTAHFGKGVSATPPEESKTQLTSALNLTQALNYLRSTKPIVHSDKVKTKKYPYVETTTQKLQKIYEATEQPTETEIRFFEPMRLKKTKSQYKNLINKAKRGVEVEGNIENYEIGGIHTERLTDEKFEEIPTSGISEEEILVEKKLGKVKRSVRNVYVLSDDFRKRKQKKDDDVPSAEDSTLETIRETTTEPQITTLSPRTTATPEVVQTLKTRNVNLEGERARRTRTRKVIKKIKAVTRRLPTSEATSTAAADPVESASNIYISNERSKRSDKFQRNVPKTRFMLFPVSDFSLWDTFGLNRHSETHKPKRNVHLIRERDKRSDEEKYEGNDENDEPHNEKNEEIEEDERKRIEEENREKEKYEEELREEISQKEKEILKQTFKNLGVQEDISEVFPELPDHESEETQITTEPPPSPVDPKKYPFYFAKGLPENSPLRYVTDPRQFPFKSGHRMEFYESREKLIQCPDFHPDLEDLPNGNSTEYSDEQPGNKQRLAGLGDKILCLRAKYFGEDPFDSPIFKEKEIDYVGKPRKGLKNYLKEIKASQTKTVSKVVETKSQKKEQTEINTEKPETGTHSKFFEKPIHATEIRNEQHKIPTGQASAPKKVYTLPQRAKKPVKVVPEQAKVIPVTEAVDEVVSTTPKVPSTMKLVTERPKYSPYVRPDPSLPSHRIVIPQKCMNTISKVAALDGTKNLIVDCIDAILVQEVIDGVGHLRIIPKTSESDSKTLKNIWQNKTPIEKYPDQTDWVPIVGYVLPKNRSKLRPFSRKTDEVTVTKNETNQNSSSDHYVIDELKEDENVRKGEVVEDMDHFLKLMDEIGTEVPEVTTVQAEIEKYENSTREKRQAPSERLGSKKKPTIKRPSPISILEMIEEKPQNQEQEPTESPESEDNTLKPISNPLEKKRPLTRLSGRDFLVRYHKNKGKPSAKDKTADFWKITTSNTIEKSTQKPQKKYLEPVKPTKDPYAERLIDTPQPRITYETPKPTQLIYTPNLERTSTKPEKKEASEFRKTTTKVIINTTEKPIVKPEPKHTSEFRKYSPYNAIGEKKPEVKQSSEFRKPSTFAPVTDSIAIELEDEEDDVKVVSKVSREISESTEKSKILHKKFDDSTVKPSKSVLPKPETLRYKTIDRNSSNNNNSSNSSSKNKSSNVDKIEVEEVSSRFIDPTDGPILYYVIDGKTGRGRWITSYDERRRISGSPGKRRKTRKLIKTEKKLKKV